MTLKFPIVILIVFCGLSCETDPDINLDVDQSPVVYAIFDKADSVNNIFLTKTFSGDPLGAYHNAKIIDSLYYDNVDVTVRLFFEHKTDSGLIIEKKNVKGEEGLFFNKEAGIFSSQSIRYVFRQSLSDCYAIRAWIKIPGKDTLVYNTEVINTPKINSPKSDASYIALRPDMAFSVHWQGNSWNEIKIQIVVNTKTETSISKDTLTYFKKGLSFQEGSDSKSFVASFSYDSYLGLLNSTLDTVSPVEFRQIEDISLEVSCGNQIFKDYMDHYYQLSDEVATISTSQAPSLFTSKSSKKLKGLQFDPASIDYMKQDPLLKKFNFVYY
jgi:hypothetical protein